LDADNPAKGVKLARRMTRCAAAREWTSVRRQPREPFEDVEATQLFAAGRMAPKKEGRNGSECDRQVLLDRGCKPAALATAQRKLLCWGNGSQQITARAGVRTGEIRTLSKSGRRQESCSRRRLSDRSVRGPHTVAPAERDHKGEAGRESWRSCSERRLMLEPEWHGLPEVRITSGPPSTISVEVSLP
jgi:hypothetical protein